MSEHSRLDADHYMNCNECYNDHLDMVSDMAHDAELDEM